MKISFTTDAIHQISSHVFDSLNPLLMVKINNKIPHALNILRNIKINYHHPAKGIF